MNRTRIAAIAIAILAVVGLSSCTQEASDVNKNLTNDADNFKVSRTVTFVNGITDKVILQIQGYCSVDPGNAARMTVTCKTDQGQYVRHALGKADNVFWFYEQTQPQDVSRTHYRFVIRPSALVPELTVRP